LQKVTATEGGAISVVNTTFGGPVTVEGLSLPRYGSLVIEGSSLAQGLTVSDSAIATESHLDVNSSRFAGPFILNNTHVQGSDVVLRYSSLNVSTSDGSPARAVQLLGTTTLSGGSTLHLINTNVNATQGSAAGQAAGIYSDHTVAFAGSDLRITNSAVAGRNAATNAAAVYSLNLLGPFTTDATLTLTNSWDALVGTVQVNLHTTTHEMIVDNVNNPTLALDITGSMSQAFKIDNSNLSAVTLHNLRVSGAPIEIANSNVGVVDISGTASPHGVIIRGTSADSVSIHDTVLATPNAVVLTAMTSRGPINLTRLSTDGSVPGSGLSIVASTVNGPIIIAAANFENGLIAIAGTTVNAVAPPVLGQDRVAALLVIDGSRFAAASRLALANDTFIATTGTASSCAAPAAIFSTGDSVFETGSLLDLQGVRTAATANDWSVNCPPPDATNAAEYAAKLESPFKTGATITGSNWQLITDVIGVTCDNNGVDLLPGFANAAVGLIVNGSGYTLRDVEAAALTITSADATDAATSVKVRSSRFTARGATIVDVFVLGTGAIELRDVSVSCADRASTDPCLEMRDVIAQGGGTVAVVGGTVPMMKVASSFFSNGARLTLADASLAGSVVLHGVTCTSCVLQIRNVSDSASATPASITFTGGSQITGTGRLTVAETQLRGTFGATPNTIGSLRVEGANTVSAAGTAGSGGTSTSGYGGSGGVCRRRLGSAGGVKLVVTSSTLGDVKFPSVRNAHLEIVENQLATLVITSVADSIVELDYNDISSSVAVASTHTGTTTDHPIVLRCNTVAGGELTTVGRSSEERLIACDACYVNLDCVDGTAVAATGNRTLRTCVCGGTTAVPPGSTSTVASTPNTTIAGAGTTTTDAATLTPVAGSANTTTAQPPTTTTPASSTTPAPPAAPAISVAVTFSPDPAVAPLRRGQPVLVTVTVTARGMHPSAATLNGSVTPLVSLFIKPVDPTTRFPGTVANVPFMSDSATAAKGGPSVWPIAPSGRSAGEMSLTAPLFAPSGTRWTTTGSAVAFEATAVVPFVMGLDCVADIVAFDVSAQVTDFAAGVSEAATAGLTDSPTAVLSPAVDTVLRTGAVTDMRITSVAPPTNQMAYGTTVTVSGTDLQLLPALMPVGPTLAAVIVAPTGHSATFTIPPKSASWRKDPATASLAMKEDMLAVLAAVTPSAQDPAATAAFAYLGTNGVVTAAKYFVETAVSDGSFAKIATVRGETAVGEAMDLGRFNVDLANAAVGLNPKFTTPAPTSPPVPGQPPASTPPPPVALPSTSSSGQPQLELPIFIEGTELPATATLEATITVPGDVPAVLVSTGVTRTVPVTDSDGNIIGAYVYFKFNGTITPKDATKQSLQFLIRRWRQLEPVGGASRSGHRHELHRQDGRRRCGRWRGAPHGHPTRRRAPHDVHLQHHVCRAVVFDHAGSDSALPRARGRAGSVRGDDHEPPSPGVHRLHAVRAYIPRKERQRYMRVRPDQLLHRLRYGCAGASTTATHRQSASSATAAWSFDLYAEPPQYFVGDVVVRLHIRAADAVWKEVVLRLTRDAPTADGLLMAAPSASGGPAAPLGGDGSPTSPTTNAAGATDAPPATEGATTAASNFQSAVVRGIFSFNGGGGCNTAHVNFLAATAVVYIAVMAIRWLASLFVRRRQGTHGEDRIVTVGAPAGRALLVNHVYVGFIVPCHHYCGPVHTTLFFVHVLSLYAVASAVLNMYPGIADEGWAAKLGLAAGVSLVVTFVQPLFNVLFNMYRIIDRRTAGAFVDGDGFGYEPQDLVGFGVDRNNLSASARRPSTPSVTLPLTKRWW
jgi:hypothetical protein